MTSTIIMPNDAMLSINDPKKIKNAKNKLQRCINKNAST
jgi:hypothetical protein